MEEYIPLNKLEDSTTSSDPVSDGLVPQNRTEAMTHIVRQTHESEGSSYVLGLGLPSNKKIGNDFAHGLQASTPNA